MIYFDGNPITGDRTYLSSLWAVPEIDLDGDLFPCYRMQHEVPDWNEKTQWPETALKILN